MLCREVLPDRRTVWPWFQTCDRLRSSDEQGMPNNKTNQTLERIDGLNAGNLSLSCTYNVSTGQRRKNVKKFFAESVVQMP